MKSTLTDARLSTHFIFFTFNRAGTFVFTTRIPGDSGSCSRERVLVALLEGCDPCAACAPADKANAFPIRSDDNTVPVAKKKAYHREFNHIPIPFFSQAQSVLCGKCYLPFIFATEGSGAGIRVLSEASDKERLHRECAASNSEFDMQTIVRWSEQNGSPGVPV